jgi:8-oxo-dGTP pyrophosphatase MutT (NUDIX family)
VQARRIRTAASVIAVREGREGKAGPEILVLERGRESRFLPGYVAFPGGAVDDVDAAAAERWFGDRDEAARAGAVRELIEEVGIVLTSDGLVGAGSASAFRSTAAAPPSVAQMPEIAHWVAPEEVPVRFDARYFAVAGGEGLDPTPDGVEAADAWWISPSELMHEWAAGRRKLYWPTWFTVERLVACASVSDVLALRIETREPRDEEVERMHRSVFFQD